MQMINQAEIKWIARKIRRRLPGWKIEGLVTQTVNGCVFKVVKDGRTAHLHVVKFTPRDSVWVSNPQMNWSMRAGSYLAWVQKLCMMQDCDPLALPTECADASSFVGGRAKIVFALRPELLPLEAGQGKMYSPLETAQMLHALCRALARCREERIPHGEVSSQRLMRRADGGFCLDGMLEPQRLNDFNQMMPSESSEVQQAALLVRSVAMPGRQDAVADYAQDSLLALIDRASVREKGLTLQRMITELDGIIEAFQQSAEPPEACLVKAGTSPFRDLTDLFAAEEHEDTVAVKGGHVMQSNDLDMTVGVRKPTESIPRAAAKTAAMDPDTTVGLRNQMDYPLKAGTQDDPENDGRTIATL